MNQIDAQLFAELDALPALPFARLVRQDLASLSRSKAAFFASGELPHFTYSKADAFDGATYIRNFTDFKSRLPAFDAPDDVRELYTAKIDELLTRANLVRAIQDRDDERVTSLAVTLFDTPLQSADDLNKEFEAILSKAHIFRRHQTKVDAEAFAEMTRRLFAAYHMDAWKIRLTKRSSVSIGRAIVRIPRNLAISRARAARLLTHEVEVHALRTANGERSPLQLLGRGLANYTQTEEGLAIFFQNKLRSQDATDPGFWDAWTVALTQKLGFADVFTALASARHKLNKALGVEDAETQAQDAAWRLCVRAYRGITHPGAPGLGFIRDHVYRSGLITVRKTLRNNPDALPFLFAGHASVEHLPILKSLAASGETPRLLSSHIVKDVMRERRKHKTG